MILHGDCLERLREIPDGSVDMVLADLPYGTTACKRMPPIDLRTLALAYPGLVLLAALLACLFFRGAR